eukprot:TRINITY_DN12127_c0_g2_i2.p2 TRINITY_DN12127_c0_g2~~TRINITY_DN12127_c0_g2_i2.p2  ORF type:complete len:137 (+),score=15.83 TRINITY_DN12127_c0_g2_i2:2373-2783(+)
MPFNSNECMGFRDDIMFMISSSCHSQGRSASDAVVQYETVTPKTLRSTKLQALEARQQIPRKEYENMELNANPLYETGGRPHGLKENPSYMSTEVALPVFGEAKESQMEIDLYEHIDELSLQDQDGYLHVHARTQT